MAQIRFEKDGKVYEIFTGIVSTLIYLSDEEKKELQEMPEGSCMMILPKHEDESGEVDAIKSRLNSAEDVQTLK